MEKSQKEAGIPIRRIIQDSGIFEMSQTQEPPKQTWETHAPEETIACGERIAQMLTPGMNVALDGDLGSGKTTLIKGIARGLGLLDAAQVKSPTFVIFHIYKAEVPIYHFDLYRLNDESDLDAIGFDEFLADPEAISVVEWAGRIPLVYQQTHLHVSITAQSETDRIIQLIYAKTKPAPYSSR